MAKRLRTIEDSSEEDERVSENLSASEEPDDNSGSEEEEEEEEEEDEEEEEEEVDDEEEEEEDEEDDEDQEELLDDAEEDEGDNNDGEDDEDEEVDLSARMTARQRNKRDGTSANIGLIDLAEIEGTNRPKKVQLSAEEQRIKRAEMARRRRNLSQQRLEEEKKETLDKLLKKRAKKVRGNEELPTEGGKPMKSRLHPKHPAFATWTSTKEGDLLSVIDADRLR